MAVATKKSEDVSLPVSVMKSITFRIEGLEGQCLMFHNGQLANFFYPYTKALKEFTKRRGKTEEDMIQLSKVEWEGGLYMSHKNPDGTWAEDSHVIIPRECLFATILSGAKKYRMGSQFKAGAVIEADARLIHEGGKTLAALRGDERFIHICLVDVNGAKVPRTRPKFDKWSAEFTIQFDESVIDEADIIRAVEAGGRLVGLCEMRPTQGRYRIVGKVAD